MAWRRYEYDVGNLVNSGFDREELRGRTIDGNFAEVLEMDSLEGLLPLYT